MSIRPKLRLINTSKWNKEHRRQAWQHIRENNHQLVALLSDPQFQSIKDHFGGVVMLRVEDIALNKDEGDA